MRTSVKKEVPPPSCYRHKDTNIPSFTHTHTHTSWTHLQYCFRGHMPLSRSGDCRLSLCRKIGGM